MSTPPNLNALWAWTLVEALVAGGVRDVCITPGSRSTPLVCAVDTHPELRPWLHLDERASAFFALGLAKATGRPVALVCTSGTAPANYYPAVIEASLSGVPLIVLSADRPLGLRATGAAQTIDQVRLYGEAAKDYLETPLPVPELASLRRLTAGVLRATVLSMEAPRGPVHLNVPFADPLPPVPSDDPRLVALWEAVSSRAPRVSRPVRLLPQPEIGALAAWLQEARRPLIVVGPEAEGARGALELGRRIGAPVLTDVASGVRYLADLAGVRCAHHEAFLRAEVWHGQRPDRILRLGALPTAATLNKRLLEWAPEVAILQADWERRDPEALVTWTLSGDVADALDRVNECLPEGAPAGAWLERWIRADRAAAAVAEWGGPEALEARAVAEAIAQLPSEAQVFLSSSMPIRYAESLSSRAPAGTRVLVSRGANGIDGIVSSALGAAAGTGRPTLLVTGDVAALHDLGGMLGGRLLESPFVMVLLNNDGGGIFSHLPISKHSDVFEPYFGTPHGRRFDHAAVMFGWEYRQVDDDEGLRSALSSGWASSTPTLIEVRTERVKEAAAYQALVAAMAEAGAAAHFAETVG